MHDLGTIGRGESAASVDGTKAAEHLLAQPWPWKTRAAASAGQTQERSVQSHPSTKRAHPPGLYFVCGAELCERFAGGLLLSLLVLYLTERLGQPPAQAIRWVGMLNAAGYAAALGGGWLLGQALPALRVAMLGALLLAAGFVALSVEHRQSLPLAFVLLIAGSGLFRPAITLLLGQLYSSRDLRRDAGHTWFWIAVNVGSALAPLFAGAMRAVAGWQVTFATAVLSMFASVLILVIGKRHLRRNNLDAIGESVPPAAPALGRKGHLRILGAASFAALLYNVAYGQVDGALLLWARDQTNRFIGGHEIPTAWFSSLPALLVLLIGPGLLMIMDGLRSRGHEPSAFAKISLGLTISGTGYALMAFCASTATDVRSSPLWLLGCCSALVVGELLILPTGLALVTRLLTNQYGGLGSGLWFAVTAIGLWVGGEIGAVGQHVSAVWLFGELTSILVVGAVMVHRMRRLREDTSPGS